MIAETLSGRYGNGVKLSHVRMGFSRHMRDVGRFRIGKLWELLRVIVAIWLTRFRRRSTILYYFPAGPSRIPIYRDLAILLATRWLFRRTIFHFRAGGIGGYYNHASPLVRLLMRRAYFKADAAIRLSDLAPADGAALRARREYIVPNGIRDPARNRPRHQSMHDPPVILYVGVIKESKGIVTLLEACRGLMAEGCAFLVDLVGQFESSEFESKVTDIILAYGLQKNVAVRGQLVGQAKWERYAAADLLCFPTFFESETFGNVLLEAMSFELPVVSTYWRGIPSIVVDGLTGYLVPIRDARALKEQLRVLLLDPELRRRMGREGRTRFRERFAWPRYEADMRRVFLDVARDGTDS